MTKTKKTLQLAALVLALLVLFAGIVFVLPGAVETSAAYGTWAYTTKVLDKSKVTTVAIEIDPEDWQELLENATAEEYYTANVVVNGTRMNNVAIRAKGNSSLSTVAQDADSDRYSFKIDIDHYDDQNLYGLTKLCLNNCYTDPSYMREYLSYCLMEEMGVATPAFAYTWVTVNGEDWGLYLGVEAVEETLLDRRYTDGTGDLYKPEGTTLNFTGDEIVQHESSLALKTNAGSSDHSALATLLDTINADEVTGLEDVMDVDAVIRYFAANTALVSLDSYQGMMLHNYYLYEDNGVFSIIPWDYDLSFGAFGGGGFGGGEMPDFAAGEMPDAAGDEVTDSTEDTVPDFTEGEMPAMPAFGGAGEPPAFGGEMPAFGGEAPTTDEPSVAPSEAAPSADTQIGDGAEAQTGGGRGNRGGMGGFGGGGSGMGGHLNLSDDTINFPVDTPVSGYNVEDYPLIWSWLQQDEYKALYHSYLEEIATGFFSESRITTLVGATMEMIASYVAADPTKKYTVDDFTKGGQDLIDFCTQRGESIQKQLSGELESAKEATSSGTGMGGFGGGGPGGGDGANRPNFGDGEMPDFAEGEMPNFAEGEVPDFAGGEMPDFASDRGGGMPGFGGGQQTQTVSAGTALLMLGGSLAVLLVALGAVLVFRRRGRHQKVW